MELRRNPELKSAVLGFVDDDPRKRGMLVSGLPGARQHGRPAAGARRHQAGRGGHRDPLGSRHRAPEGGHRLPRARHPGAHAAHHLRAALPRPEPAAPGARGAGGGRARARARAGGDRSRGRLPQRPRGAGDRRGRLDRLGAVPPDRAREAQAPGAGGPRREQPLRDPPPAGGGAPLRRAHGGARRLQGRHAHARAVRRGAALGGVPRGGLQARPADGGEPGGGRAQQRGGHPHRGGGGGRGGRGALPAGVHRQGRDARHRDGRVQGARGVGRGGRAEPLPRHAVRGGAVRQRAGLLRLGGADLPPPDRRRRPGHGHRRGHVALLHDDPRGRAADHPLG